MSCLTRILGHNARLSAVRNGAFTTYSTKVSDDTEAEPEFRVLNLRASKRQQFTRAKFQKQPVLPPRSHSMPVDQDWGSVWPGPRTFHPAAVPLPVRQGFVEKGAPPDKLANAELMKIPNFLHLTPPVVARQCEALKKFCTPWPKQLKTDEDCERHFPIEAMSSSYCHSSPSIRDPMARIVTVRFRLDRLGLDGHARDKFLRLVGERYDEATGYVTIVTDRCPMRKQNYDYAMYLITALYHESWNVEPWEALKSDDDMERYDWEKSASKEGLEKLFANPVGQIKGGKEYSEAVSNLMNEGESDYTLNKYSESVRNLFGLPQKPITSQSEPDEPEK